MLERCRKNEIKKMHVIYCPFCQLEKQNRIKQNKTYLYTLSQMSHLWPGNTRYYLDCKGGLSLAVLAPFPTQGFFPFPLVPYCCFPSSRVSFRQCFPANTSWNQKYLAFK